MTLSEHGRAKILATLEAIPTADRSEIYAVSLYVSDVDDDPRRPTITVGYNTERPAAACTPAAGQEAKWPIASDAAEAGWNYAVWLQNALTVIGDKDTDRGGTNCAAAALRSWTRGGSARA